MLHSMCKKLERSPGLLFIVLIELPFFSIKFYNKTLQTVFVVCQIL